jgi:hypothetical protein
MPMMMTSYDEAEYFDESDYFEAQEAYVYSVDTYDEGYQISDDSHGFTGTPDYDGLVPQGPDGGPDIMFLEFIGF